MNRRISLRLSIAMPSIVQWPLRWVGNIRRLFVRWRRLAYERRLLASLDDRMLRDIGVSRSDAEAESGKPFWREH